MTTTLITDYFNNLGDRWDRICTHPAGKIAMMLDKVQIHKGARILDVGCGTGIMEEYLIKYNPETIIAIDIASSMIDKAKGKYRDERIHFVCGDILTYKDKPFDYIILYNVYPHFMEPEKLFKHLHSLMSPNSKLVICHSESKEKINRHHHRHAPQISKILLPAKEVSALMTSYFLAETIEDNSDLYLIIAHKTTI